MIHPLKITGTMSDKTRYLIYEHLLKHKRAFTVQEIADEFGIHPNVARHHLTKLTEINIISANLLKTGKGGRPGRVYEVLEDCIQLSFPKRDDAQLLEWLIEAIAQNEDFLAVAENIAYKKGQQSIAMIPGIQNLSLEQRIQLLEEQAALIGYIVQTDANANPHALQFHVFNCPFHSHIRKYATIVCTLHEQYLRGKFELLFQNKEFEQVTSMLSNCNECQYIIR